MAASSITKVAPMPYVAAQFDTAIHGTAVGSYGLRVRLPKGAIVYNAFADVLTACTSGTSAATIAVTTEGAGDIFAAAAVSGAPWSTTGRKQAVPDIATVGDYKKMTAEREVTVTIAVEALTAGKFDVFIFYVNNATA